MLYLWHNNYINIIPKYNLVKNIGFDHEATHTFVNDKKLELDTKVLTFPLKHPKIIRKNSTLDQKIFYNVYYNKKNFIIEYLKKVKFKVINLFYE